MVNNSNNEHTHTHRNIKSINLFISLLAGGVSLMGFRLGSLGDLTKEPINMVNRVGL